MPKAKPKSSSGIPDLDPKDVAAFKAALNTDTPDTPELAEPETDTQAEVEADAEQHVPVTTEQPAKKSTAKPMSPVDEIKQVWDEEAPATTKTAATFERARKHGPWRWMIGGLVILAGAAVAGFFVFGRGHKFTGNNIQLVINTPKEIASGGDMTLTIDYQNQEAIDLTNSQLTVTYPDGFTFSSSEPKPTNTFNNAFDLGKIGSGRAGQVVIHGTAIGSVDAQLSFAATLTYRPANFSSDFQEQTSTTVTISSSILTLNLDGPDKLSPNGVGNWTINVSNTSDHDLQGIRVEATLPNGLSLTKATPAASSGQTTWDIASVAKGKSSTITLTGTASGNLGDSLELSVQVGILNAAGTVDPQAQKSLLIALVNTGLTTSIAVNGQTDSSVINPGDTVNYTISLSNKSDVEVSDVTAAATLDGTGLDLTSLSNPLNATVKDTTLTWTKTQAPGLALIKPGQSVSLTLSVGTTSTISIKTDSDRNPHISLSVVVTAPSLATNTNTTPPATVSLTKFATVFKLTADARYYDDSQIAVGSGPVPPKVGQTTAYRIMWAVTNSTSDATDMTVTTALPVGVLWTGKNIGRDAGDISFDPNSRIVRWTLNKVPAGTGGRLPTLTAHFEVSITPTSDQVGNVVVLTDTTSGTATDSYSSKSLSITASSLTTDVPNDPQAAGEGKVVAA